MDQGFIPIFRQQVDLLSQNDPFSWIRGLVRDIAARHIQPPMELRPDGELFLLGNIGGLIVIPWDRANGTGDFRQTHLPLLSADVEVILRNAVFVTLQKGASGISARTILEVTARIPSLAVLGLNIWGP